MQVTADSGDRRACGLEFIAINICMTAALTKFLHAIHIFFLIVDINFLI